MSGGRSKAVIILPLVWAIATTSMAILHEEARCADPPKRLAGRQPGSKLRFFLRRARRLARFGNFRMAAEIYRKALSSPGCAPSVRLELVETLRRSGRYGRALAHLDVYLDGRSSPSKSLIEQRADLHRLSLMADIEDQKPVEWKRAPSVGGIDGGRTNWTSSSAPSSAPRPLFRVATRGGVVASPVVERSVAFYIGDLSGVFYAITAKGGVRWKRTLGAPIRTPAAVGPSGRVYVTTADGLLHCLDRATGRRLWARRYGRVGASAVIVDATGRIGLVSDKLKVYSSDGSLSWQWSPPNTSCRAGPSLDKTGIWYMGCDDGRVYGVAVRRGRLEATFSARCSKAPVTKGITVGARPTLFATTLDGMVCAISPELTSERPLWRVKLRSRPSAAPSLGPKGTVVIGSSAGRVTAISPFGRRLWSYEVPGSEAIGSRPLVDRKGRVVFGSRDGKVRCLDGRGRLIWSLSVKGDADAGPAIGFGSTVLIGDSLQVAGYR